MTEIANDMGRGFCEYAVAMFVQTGVLVAIVLGINLLLRNRVRATLRYWIWMLVFVKLLLPPGLCLPTGVGYWLGGHEAPPVPPLPQVVETDVSPVRMATEVPVEIPPAAGGSPSPAITVAKEAVAAGSARLTWQGSVLLLWIAGVLVFAALVLQRLLFVR